MKKREKKIQKRKASKLQQLTKEELLEKIKSFNKESDELILAVISLILDMKGANFPQDILKFLSLGATVASEAEDIIELIMDEVKI